MQSAGFTTRIAETLWRRRRQAAAFVLAVAASSALAADASASWDDSLWIDMYLPDGTAGDMYDGWAFVEEATSPVTCSIASGALPPGISLHSTHDECYFIGEPYRAGTYNFVLQVKDAGGKTATESGSIKITNPVITISPSSLSDGTVGTAYSATISAKGAMLSLWYFSVRGSLPPGLSLSSVTGVLSGTPTAGGNYAFTISAWDMETNTTGTRDYSLSIAWPPIAVTPASLSDGKVNNAYSATIGATGGTSSYSSFAVTAGSLPEGLALNASTGALTGTPGKAGSASFTVTVTDSRSATGSRAYDLTITAADAIVIGPASLANGSTGAAYSQTLTASHCVSACTFSVASGLPPGLSLNGTTGVISGTPSAAGSYDFTVTATEGTNKSNRAFTIVIYAPVAVVPTVLPGGVVGGSYSVTISATGGTGSYGSVSLSAGSLPPGLTLSPASRTISGTPTRVGHARFTVTVTDTASHTATRTYTLAISAATIAVDVEPGPDGVSGAPYSRRIVATGGLSPYTYQVIDGALPSGLALDSSLGLISGTPTRAGQSRFTVQATDAADETAVAAASITVQGGAILTIAPESLPGSLQGVRYAATLTARGGIGPYSYAVVAGALPPGLTLAPAEGVISGMSTSAGSYSFTVKATDSNGDFGVREYTVVISGRPDPSRDAEVIGLVDSQFQAARRFSGAQIDNVMRHLVGLRETFACGVHPGVTLNVGPVRPPVAEGAENPAAGALASNALNQAVGQIMDGDCAQAAHRWGAWTAGAVDYDSGRGTLSATALTAGLETQISRSLVLGVAFGAGFDRDRIGNNGTKTRSSATSLMAYGSYRVDRRLFVEAAGGYSRLRSDNSRFVGADGSLLESRRPGRALSASLGLGSQVRASGLAALPYLRFDLIAIRLDAYQESAPTPFALGFAQASQTLGTLVAGTRLTYALRLPRGRLSPLSSVEYRHRFAAGVTQAMFYVDHPEMTYTLQRVGEARDSVSATAGVELALGGLVVDIEYDVAGASVGDLEHHGLHGSLRLGF